MNKLTFGITLVAVMALGAMASAPALATSKFLANGAEISVDLSFSLGAEILIEEMSASGTPDYLCSWTFDGLIEPGGTSIFINELLMLNGELLAAEALKITGTVKDLGGEVSLGTPAGWKINEVECEDTKGTCTGVSKLTALHLPWHLEVVLLENGTYMLHFLEESEKTFAYILDCTTIIGLVENICDGLTYALLENIVEGVLMEFSENTEVTPPLSCSLGSAEQQLMTMDNRIEAKDGSSLSVSE